METTRIASRFLGLARSCAVVSLMLIGCAEIDDAIKDHPATGGVLDAGAPCMLAELTPPPIALTASAGDQSGVQGSFCSNDDRRGCGVCADSARLTAKRFTVVHTGDQVTLSMSEGTLVTPGPDQCQPACPPQIAIVSLCDKQSVVRDFTEDEAWTIDLNAGVYQLDVSSSFSSGELHGQTEDTFGLIVDDARDRGIVEANAPGTSCGDAGSP